MIHDFRIKRDVIRKWENLKIIPGIRHKMFYVDTIPLNPQIQTI